MTKTASWRPLAWRVPNLTIRTTLLSWAEKETNEMKHVIGWITFFALLPLVVAAGLAATFVEDLRDRR